jgi:hypothetical protein
VQFVTINVKNIHKLISTFGKAHSMLSSTITVMLDKVIVEDKDSVMVNKVIVEDKDSVMVNKVIVEDNIECAFPNVGLLQLLYSP